MKSLALGNIGPIVEANLIFGDLTVFVGPQASGKSIALQCLKLLVDSGQVKQQMRQYGLDWEGKVPPFFDAYFGEGMHSIWGADSRIVQDGKSIDINALVRSTKPKHDEHAFLIPAQRVLTLRNGWPRPFADYAPGDPFAVRDFSEKLRVLVEQEFVTKSLFPQKGRLKNELREMLNEHVFGGFGLQVDKLASQKRLVLSHSESLLPYMVWSAGQREFVPLLLGLYWLMPPGKVSRRGRIEWVMLEEIEMGLHPWAINVVLLMVLELVSRGYRVCLSTHSPQVLEAIWAIRWLQAANKSSGGGTNRTAARAKDDATSALLKMFSAPRKPGMVDLASNVLDKTFKVYSFDRETGRASDISGLDPDAMSRVEATWGGLAEFSETANAEVARAMANATEEA